MRFFSCREPRSSSDTLRHSSVSSWERVLQRGVWFWGKREDKDRSSSFISMGEPWLDGGANIFYLGKFSWNLLSMWRDLFCILVALGVCPAGAPWQWGFSSSNSSCKHCKSGNAKPQAQEFVSCFSPNPLELIIAKDILQREMVNLWETAFCLSAPENLTVGQMLWLLSRSFRHQLFSQNFWDMEHSYLGSQNTPEWTHSFECRCSWELSLLITNILTKLNDLPKCKHRIFHHFLIADSSAL